MLVWAPSGAEMHISASNNIIQGHGLDTKGKGQIVADPLLGRDDGLNDVLFSVEELKTVLTDQPLTQNYFKYEPMARVLERR